MTASEYREVSGIAPWGGARRDTRLLLRAGRGHTAQSWVLDRLRKNPPEDYQSAPSGGEECPDRLFALGFCILRMALQSMWGRSSASRHDGSRLPQTVNHRHSLWRQALSNGSFFASWFD